MLLRDTPYSQKLLSEVSHTINVNVDTLLRNLIENTNKTRYKQHLKMRKRLKPHFTQHLASTGQSFGCHPTN